MQWRRVRQVANWLNLTTPAGLALAALGRAQLRSGPGGLLLAGRLRLPTPGAAAFTVGDVVLTRRPPAWLLARPRLLAHEERHAWQYALLLGVPFWPLYALAAGWSWLRVGDVATGNPFERWAGLADGGYPAR